MPNKKYESEQSSADDRQQFYVVSLKKVAVVSFFTFGWYWLFCFHRSWVLHRKYTGERVLPLLRALFAAFFIYALLKRVDGKLRLSGATYHWSPLMLTLSMIATALLPIFLGQRLIVHGFHALVFIQFLLAVLNTWCVVAMQKAINYSEGDVGGEINANFTVANWLWMALGLLFWPGIVFLALLALLMGIDSGSA